MNFNVFASNSLYYGFEKVLEKLKFNYVNEKFEKHFVVVPDKFTLNAEKAIFDYLNIDCFFNIEVITLSHLTSKILKESTKTIISKQASIMLINNLLHKNLDNLQVFKNAIAFSGFSENLFETISQFKSCETEPDKINIDSQNNLSKLKTEDLKFIYYQYEKYLKENSLWDNFDRLKFATESLKESDFKSTAFYFSYFNSLTAQQLTFLKKLIYSADEVNFSCNAPINQNNAQIYPKELFHSLVNLTSKTPNVKFCDAKIDFNIKHILKNLCCIKPRKTDIKNYSVALFECVNIEEEVLHIAKTIKSKIVFNNYQFNDFAILCSNFVDYKSVIKKAFNDFELPVFFDDSISLNEHFYAKYILSLLRVINNNFEQNDVVDFTKNCFSSLTIDEQNIFENITLKLGLKNNNFKNIDKFETLFGESFNNIKKFLKTIFDFQKIFSSKKQVSDKIEIIKEFLNNQNIKEKLQNAILNFAIANNLVWEKFTQEVFDKVENIFNEVEKTFLNMQLNNEEFYNIIESGFLSAKLNLVPTAVDNIFVGDINSSFILPVKNLFILGASENNLPLIQKDCGLLVDAELNQIKNNKIEPTIREINKRTKFFEFQQFLTAKENLSVSYSTANSKQANIPSIFINNLQKMFEFQGKCLPIIRTKFLENDLRNEQLQQYFCANIFNKNKTLSFLNNFKINVALKKCYNRLIKKLKFNENLNNETNKNILNLNENEIKQLFFKNDKVSASQLECYFACPYKHFYRYAIKPVQREIAQLKPMDIGTLLHFIAQKFIENYKAEILTKEQLKILSKKYFELALTNLSFTNNVDNKYFVKSLKDESSRLILKLYEEKQNSKFDNFAVEKTFSNNSIFENLKFNGVVDRIDIFENYFRIIDYKSVSGNSSSSIDLSLKKLYSGQKLQLFLYAGVVEKILNKQLSGVFYFPIKNTYTINSQDNNSSTLIGYFLNEKNILTALDKTENQNIVEVKTANLLSKNQIEQFKNYAFEISTQAIREILTGNIQPSPIGDENQNSCSFCEYKSMCTFDFKKDGLRKIDEKIDKQFFESVNKDGK